jgi:hypothetical protein
MVYSAFDAHANFNDNPYSRHYTDYRILTEDGRPLRNVRNETHTLPGSPAEVELAPGTYRVVARANGRGVVTVPAVIKRDRVTTVHLEGGARRETGG